MVQLEFFIYLDSYPRVTLVSLLFSASLPPNNWVYLWHTLGVPQWLSGKESTCNAGDLGDEGSIPGSGRSPRGGKGNLLQYSCLENPTDRGAWRATVHGVAKSRTRLSDEHTHSHHGKIRGMPNSKPEDHRAYYQIGTAYARGKEDLTGTTPEESRHSTSQSC